MSVSLLFTSILCLVCLLIDVHGFTKACSGQQVKIALLGDSLTRRAFVYFDLANLISQQLKIIQSGLNYNIEYNCLASDGSKIIDIEKGQLWPISGFSWLKRY